MVQVLDSSCPKTLLFDNLSKTGDIFLPIKYPKNLRLIIESVTNSLAHALNLKPSRAQPMKLVVAVSGGIDSIVLLHILSQRYYVQSVELYVAHINHKLRSDSDKEEQFVLRFCKELGVECRVFTCPKIPVGANLEDWARKQRYDFFYKCLNELQADWIVTAHHQKDQAETFLWRLFSGRMASSSLSISYIDEEKMLFRPFLKVSRKDIQFYAKHYDLSFVHDSSNDDISFSRNFLRHEIIPRLTASLNPSLIPTLSQVSERMNEDEMFLWEQALLLSKNISRSSSLDSFLAFPEALRWRILRCWIAKELGEEIAAAQSYSALQRVFKISKITSHKEKILELNAGLRISILQGSHIMRLSVVEV